VLKEGGEIALVTAALALKPAGQVSKDGVVVVSGVGGGENKANKLSQVVNHQVQLQAIKPTHGTFAFAGKAPENLALLFSSQVTGPELSAVNEVVATAHTLAALPKQNQEQQRHYPDDGTNKASVGRCRGKAAQVRLYTISK
jgi:hypothetical protein